MHYKGVRFTAAPFFHTKKYSLSGRLVAHRAVWYYTIHINMAKNSDKIEALKKVGGQYAVTNRYRHPSLMSYILGSKGKKKVFDLEKTTELLEKTLDFTEECGKKGYTILFISTRQETIDLIRKTAEDLSLPHMLNRWIGGTLSNFKNIRGRIEKMETMQQEKEEGKWTRYTKKEKVLFNRELTKLESKFTGIKALTELPQAIFVLDTRKEQIAVKEANASSIPVIGFSNADANIHPIAHPIIANIQSRETVTYVLGLVEEAYRKGMKNRETKSVSNENSTPQKEKEKTETEKSGNSSALTKKPDSIGSKGR